jgi:SHS2 domain-containing protein
MTRLAESFTGLVQTTAERERTSVAQEMEAALARHTATLAELMGRVIEVQPAEDRSGPAKGHTLEHVAAGWIEQLSR